MKVIDPLVTAERVEPAAAEIDIVVPQDLEYLRGHFPGAPIVPGVVQVRWALLLARRYLHVEGACVRIEALKFQSAMPPGARAIVALEVVEPARKLHFAFRWAQGRYSSGRLLLRGRTGSAAADAP